MNEATDLAEPKTEHVSAANRCSAVAQALESATLPGVPHVEELGMAYA